MPGDCPRAARRLDFITFHYKVFTETGKKVDQTYVRHKAGIRIQLGTGMIIPGLEKGMKGMCDQELRWVLRLRPPFVIACLAVSVLEVQIKEGTSSSPLE